VRILWSPQSLRDLDAIHEYIAKDAEHYAGLTSEGAPSLHCTIPTEGAPSLRFLQGWAAMLPGHLLSVRHYPLRMLS
jgi:hypothetical protein